MIINMDILSHMKEWMQNNEDIPDGWIYLGDEKERYILGQPGRYNMLVFGVNPSTASPGENNLDPTIRKVRNVIRESSYDGWIMANLYPLRSTDPKVLPESANEEILDNNLKALEALNSEYHIGAAWAAWGNAIDTRFYLGEALYDIQDKVGDFEWYHLGQLTKRGNPRHPLYIKSGEQFHWFPVFDYASNWCW